MSLLELSEFRAGYGLMEVVHGIDLSVEAGEAVVLLGANGAGKTTTLRAISGTASNKGVVAFGGRPLPRRRTPDQVARLGIAHVPQGRGTITDLTVEENLILGGYPLRQRRQLRNRLDQWLEVFPHLARRRSSKAGSLSGGEQQMLAIARALMAGPQLLLLDEPSLGLAPIIAEQVYEILVQVRTEADVAMLIVEQNASLALAVASRGYVIESGTIVTSDSAEHLRASDTVRRAYLGI